MKALPNWPSSPLVRGTVQHIFVSNRGWMGRERVIIMVEYRTQGHEELWDNESLFYGVECGKNSVKLPDRAEKSQTIGYAYPQC